MSGRRRAVAGFPGVEKTGPIMPMTPTPPRPGRWQLRLCAVPHTLAKLLRLTHAGSAFTIEQPDVR